MDLTIILPVHNEADVIESVVIRVEKLLSARQIKYEILCIENGSKDNSWDIIKKLAKNISSVKNYQSKQGWGNAVRKGIQLARGRLCCYMVSDWQMDPRYIIKLLDVYAEHQKDSDKSESRNHGLLYS